MCLLKRDEHDTNCGHEECKNYYMLNKQICMYNMGTPQQTTNNQQNIMTQQPQKQPIMVQPTISNNNGINAKRTIKPEADMISFIKKKMKTDEDQQQPESSQTFPEQTTKIPEFGYIQAPMLNQNQNGDRNIFNSTILNNILVPGGNQQTQYPNSTYVIPLLQNSQNQMQQPIMVQNQNSQIPVNQMFTPQTLKKTTPTPTQTTTQTPIIDNKLKTDCNPASEAFMKEFQTRILGLLFTQNKMLVELKEKNEVLQDTLASLINEINSLKGSIKQATHEKTTAITANPLVSHQIIGSSAETVTVENLLTYLYGANPDFPYQLILKSDLALPLYRERNFKFTVVLTDKKGNPIENSNRIPLTIGIYSSENPPKYIDSNTAGNKILKGFIEKDLVNGTATFEKIQIKEVTSHFRNGWVFFVVYPKLVNSTGNNVLLNGNGVFVQNNKIKPLILEKVIVKAKKAKEKDAGDLQEDDKNVDMEQEHETDGNAEKDDKTTNKEESVYL